MHPIQPHTLTEQLDEARRLLTSGKHDSARSLLRALRKDHPASLEVLALLLHALTIDFPPTNKHVDESAALMVEAPRDTRSLIGFCRMLVNEGAARSVEPLLEQHWWDLLRDHTARSLDVLPGPDENLILEAATVLADSFVAMGRFSTAQDVVDEARTRIASRELDELHARIQSAFDPNDESVPAEIHAVRRRIMRQYLDAREQDEFQDEEEARSFLGAFQTAWNEAMKEKPLPYGMMPREERDRFLDTLFERLMEILGDDADATPSEEDLARMRRIMERSAALFDHPLFERNSVLKPLAPFFPDIVVTLRYPIDIIDDFLDGATDEDIVHALKDCMDVMTHLLSMRMCEDETSYRQSFAAMWDIVAEDLTIDEAHSAITSLCERADRLLKAAGIPTVRFIPGGLPRTDSAGRNSRDVSKGGGFMKKRKKKR